MITLSARWPYIRFLPDALRPFAKAGKVDDIFRPRILGHGLFATPTGYGASFSLQGIDSEGLDRATLDHIAKQIAIANRVLPEECLVYEYLITASNHALPARPITQEAVSQQAQERTDFLKANAKFKSVRLIVTLYIPGKVPGSLPTLSSPAMTMTRAVSLIHRSIRTWSPATSPMTAWKANGRLWRHIRSTSSANTSARSTATPWPVR
jgi:hypothetical protein